MASLFPDLVPDLQMLPVTPEGEAMLAVQARHPGGCVCSACRGEGLPDGYPLVVSAAGSVQLCNSPAYRGVEVLVLVGGETAHFGVVMMTPCRLVADPTSPLRFSAVGDVVPFRGMKGLQGGPDRLADERWVVLRKVDGALGRDVDPFVRALYGRQVRIEYAPAVLA